jgi:hypothetical protein
MTCHLPAPLSQLTPQTMSSRFVSLLHARALFLRRASIGLVSIVSLLIGLAVPASGSAAPTAVSASGSAAPTPLLSPPALGAQVSALVASTTAEWASHQTPEGWLIDPVLGRATGSYGLGMTGQSMVLLGVSHGDGALIEAGLRAELAEVAQPDGGGFELLALSEAFAWNDAHLATMGAWEAARATIAAFITDHAPLVSDAGDCYSEERCYDNLKLVAAVAELSLLQTGLPDLTLGTPATIRAKALAALTQAAKNTGADARRLGTDPFRGAGILSDPGRSPLAYHVLSTLMLGQAVQNLGASAPVSVIAAFSRCARALIGLMAPDGDVAYIGRGQGQVWTVAASIDALSLAAQMTHSATWRGRYLAGAALELARLRSLYSADGWGLPLVPRLADSEAGRAAPNYLGIDGYANTVEYDGLSLWALTDAARVLSLIPPTPYQALPSTRNGAFLDPSHTKFAAVTDGRLWYAIHGSDSDPADARYGFGLISVERDSAQGWRAVLPYPPLTPLLTSTATTSGPTLIRGSKHFYPVKTHIAVGASGVVTIHAGWGAVNSQAANKQAATGKTATARAKTRKAAKVELETTWVYRPTSSENGVVLSFRACAKCAYQFPIWFQTGSEVKESKTGLTITEPNGTSQSYDFNTGIALHASSETYHSAYSEDLGSILLTVPSASRARQITYTTSFG